MSKIHVFPDEKLGGVLREYVEVDRVANVGDKIVIVNPSKFQFGDSYTQGTIMTVEKADEDGDVYCGKFDLIDIDEYQTIEPTDIVHIDGVRYRMVGRNAKVGEKVIVVETSDTLVYRNVGEIVEIIETNGGDFGGMIKPHDFGEKGAIYHFQYLVLEPIDDESPKTTEDLIANLAQRVTELERKLGEYSRKVDGMEVDIQNISIDLSVIDTSIGKVLDDIVDLDERTQPLEAIVKAVKSGE
jgi:hypothetical protein